ncbi:hypothetical protein V8C35DRAFT_311122 [Trichoderma chlorosporum]
MNLAQPAVSSLRVPPATDWPGHFRCGIRSRLFRRRPLVSEEQTMRRLPFFFFWCRLFCTNSACPSVRGQHFPCLTKMLGSISPPIQLTACIPTVVSTLPHALLAVIPTSYLRMARLANDIVQHATLTAFSSKAGNSSFNTRRQSPCLAWNFARLPWYKQQQKTPHVIRGVSAYLFFSLCMASMRSIIYR